MNFLNLNENKTDVISFGKRITLDRLGCASSLPVWFSSKKAISCVIRVLKRRLLSRRFNLAIVRVKTPPRTPMATELRRKKRLNGGATDTWVNMHLQLLTEREQTKIVNRHIS